MITVLFADRAENWRTYNEPLQSAFSATGLDVNLVRDADPDNVDYIVYAPAGGLVDFTPYRNLKAVLSLWAGVETIETNKTITVPLCRMVDTGLSEGMVEWVTGHILRHHLGIDTHIHGQDGVWRDGVFPPLARDRVVGFLGLGELGLACAQAAAALNFNVKGWSRSPKSLEGIETFSGKSGLDDVLSKADFLVLLLPDTAATKNILDRESFAKMRQDVVIINPGRGTLIDDDALLNALETDKIAHATLDVFHTEPLPKSHPYWAHPKVTVTPHIASATRPSTASLTIAENIRRGEAGEPFLHVVDRKAGY